MGRINRPSELIVISDSTACCTTNGYGYPAIYDPAGYGSNPAYYMQFYARRHSDGLNILWADGHVKWMAWQSLYGKSQYWYK
jgi:prepilin-type processing-associated H-X9-DG protein